MAILTNAGRALLTARIRGTGAEPLQVGIGSGTTAEAATQTALTTEYVTGTWSGYARAAGTSSQQTTTFTNDTWQLAGPTFTAPAAETVQEAGCFDAASAGNMLIRGLTGAVTLASGDSIVVTFKLQFS